MKTQRYILAFGLFIGFSLSYAYAQTNTVYGTEAGTGGSQNTHIGYRAGKVSTGTANTFLGHQSGSSNTTGFNNTFLGDLSGFTNTTGSYNTFMGLASGVSNTTGSRNTFLGLACGYLNTTGSNNIFLGYQSGYVNTTGSSNIFLGYQSGFKNTTGYLNTFIGHFSGYNNTTGVINTFLGTLSGFNNTTGNNNTFLGDDSGYNNTTGNNNTFVGPFSGYSNISGGKNVFIGYKAGYSEKGSNRLYIDNNDDNKPLLFGNFSFNVLSIGKKYTGTAYKLDIPGKVRATAYDVVSDERLKKDVHTLQDALTKVQKVEGVRYALKEEALVAQDDESEEKANIRSDKSPQPVLYGFLAQNIQAVFPELVTEDEGMLAVNYQGMIPVLVEAIKELTRQMQAEIDQLRQELAALKQAAGHSASSSILENTIGAQLYQNHPNPFDHNTTIGYQVAEAQQVSLVITNLQGITVQRFDTLPAGQGQVVIGAESLAAGNYIYTLVVDGKPVASQRMILSR